MKQCSNARSWSRLLIERETPEPVRHPGEPKPEKLPPRRPVTSLSGSKESKDPHGGRPSRIGADGKVTFGLPYELQYQAGDIAIDYLKHQGMKAYTKYTGLKRLPANEPECRTMWKSVLMHKGADMYKKSSFVHNPRQHRIELEKIVTRFGGRTDYST